MSLVKEYQELLNSVSEYVDKLESNEAKYAVMFQLSSHVKSKFKQNTDTDFLTPEKLKLAVELIIDGGDIIDVENKLSEVYYVSHDKELRRPHNVKILNSNISDILKDNEVIKYLIKNNIVTMKDFKGHTTPLSVLDRLVKAVKSYNYLTELERNSYKLDDCLNSIVVMEHEIALLRDITGLPAMSNRDKVELMVRMNKTSTKSIASSVGVSVRYVNKIKQEMNLVPESFS